PENGPVMAMAKCEWIYKDAGGAHSYMKGSAYLFFFKGMTGVRIRPVLRNADYGGGGTANFTSAYKGIQGYELRTGLNMSSGNFTIAGHAGNTTGSLTASDSAYIYQGYNSTHQGEGQTRYWTSDNGYSIRKN